MSGSIHCLHPTDSTREMRASRNRESQVDSRGKIAPRNFKSGRIPLRGVVGWFATAVFLFLAAVGVPAQVDQGTITGVVEDTTNAVIPNATVTLTAIDTNLVLHATSNGSGIYVFTPIKIGNYRVSASAPGFETTTQENVQLDVEGRVNVVLVLHPGGASETVLVSSAPPLLQTESGSSSHVLESDEVNNTPLNGRNWVYIAQLVPGVIGSINASPGAGTGDFFANGQRATQNNFMLDGIDNNMNTADLQAGTSYAMRPPPDALAEFRIDTTSFSAQFGHSAGAVLNASLKSGTNQIHGDMWEYFRNTALDATDWDANSAQPYRENQFGATLGGPILKNRLFYFGDGEANRIAYTSFSTLSVPTARERVGDFSELQNVNLTGEAEPVQLYEPQSAGSTKLSCNGQNNVLCSNQIDPIAQNILNLYPLPNINNGATYANYEEGITALDDTVQTDQRIDWNISPRDQAYSRWSYGHDIQLNPPPLGSILDGAGSNTGMHHSALNQAFMASETHFFSPNFSNEIRFGFNWASDVFLQANADANISDPLGFGGVPYGQPGYVHQGGLPTTSISSIQGFGTHGFAPNIERQNVYQIIDNVSKVLRNHSLAIGVSLQSIRNSFLQPRYGAGSYNYTGKFTSKLGASFTGNGIADFLAGDMNTAEITNAITSNDARWYRSAYIEDNWRTTRRLTLNLGIRYDYTQPYKEMQDGQANFYVTPPGGGIGTGTGIYQIPASDRSVTLAPGFLNVLSEDNVTLEYVNNGRLVSVQKWNFAPRFGFAFSPDEKSVIRGGFGVFYGALESLGSAVNMMQNYPFTTDALIASASCTKNPCATNGITLENGFTKAFSTGLANYISLPSMVSIDPYARTPYSMGYNVTLQRAFTSKIVMDLAYVGTIGRRMMSDANPNAADALKNPTNTAFNVDPFPQIGSVTQVTDEGTSTYNSMQVKLQRHLTRGFSLLSSYTWSHSLDDSRVPLQNGVSPRNSNLIPLVNEYTNSAWDIRHRFNFNAYYQFPYRSRGSRRNLLKLTAGDWATNLTFFAQTGPPFSVSPNISTASGGTAYAIMTHDPYAPGGAPDPSNPNIQCAASTRNRTHWYNPCAFANPLAGSLISPSVGSDGSPFTPEAGYNWPEYVTGIANAFAFLGGKQLQLYGPPYYRFNMSLFKNLTTHEKQYLQFRADIFNVFNHPTLANPATQNDNTNAGNIVRPKPLQNYTPDSRFIQLALKYVF